MVKVKRYVLIVKDSYIEPGEFCKELIKDKIEELLEIEVEVILEIGKVSKT